MHASHMLMLMWSAFSDLIAVCGNCCYYYSFHRGQCMSWLPNKIGEFEGSLDISGTKSKISWYVTSAIVYICQGGNSAHVSPSIIVHTNHVLHNNCMCSGDEYRSRPTLWPWCMYMSKHGHNRMPPATTQIATKLFYSIDPRIAWDMGLYRLSKGFDQ